MQLNKLQEIKFHLLVHIIEIIRNNSCVVEKFFISTRPTLLFYSILFFLYPTDRPDFFATIFFVIQVIK